MTNNLHEGPLSSVAQPATQKKLTWREERRLRRRRRKRGEEILAWFLVPLICVGIYLGVSAGFDFFGTSPGQVWDQLMQVKAMMEKRPSNPGARG